ncbi:hypothetical protein ACFLYU_05530, partial [Candidatus Dependentiae bacterium]
MNKKSFISLALICSLITSQAQPFFWSKPKKSFLSGMFKKTAKFFRKQGKSFGKDLKSDVPGIVRNSLILAVAGITAGIIKCPFEHVWESGKNKFWEGSKVQTLFKKIFGDPKKDKKLKKQNIKTRKVDVDFDEDFAPDTIDDETNK